MASKDKLAYHRSEKLTPKSFVQRVAASLIPSALAIPASGNKLLVVSPGEPKDVSITESNTLNGTLPNPSYPRPAKPFEQVAAGGNTERLPITIKNSFTGGQLYAYITGLDMNKRVVMLQPDGKWFYPTSTSSGVPQPITANIKLAIPAKGKSVTFTLPSFLSSGRIYLSEGELVFSTLQTPTGVSLVQPDASNPKDASAGKNWGFLELTNTASSLYCNLSFVDFVGLPIGMTMMTKDNQSHTVRGVDAGAVKKVCDLLKTYAAEEKVPWDQLCQYLPNGTPIRVVAPQKYIAGHPEAFSKYYASHIDSVWTKYSTTPLTIDSQGAAGKFKCTSSGNAMNCAGGNRPFTKPTAGEIFGCDGTFGTHAGDNPVVLATNARLCAALSRNTLMLPGGDIQPSLERTNFYGLAPTNRYAQLLHKFELDGRGYAFAFDDVNPNGHVDQSGTLSSAQAQSMIITIGGA